MEQNQPYAISLSDIGYSDPDGDPLAHLIIQSLPDVGSLELYDYPAYPGQWIDPYELHYGYLVYVPDPTAAASYSSSFAFTGNDGYDDSSPATLAFNVTVIPNSPPTVTGSSHALNATQAHTVTLADLGYSDADGDPLQWLTIQSLPTSGTLEYYGYPIYSGQTLDYYEIAYGYLTYHPDPYANSSYYDSFSFIANDGRDNSTAATVHFHVTLAENAPPTSADTSLSVPEDGYVMLGLAHFPFKDADGDEFSHITILSLPSNAELTYYGYPVSAGQSIDAYEIAYGALELAFSSAAPSNAVATFAFSVSDGRDSSAPAMLTATRAGAANQRPVTTPTQLGAVSGETLWFSTGTFPYSDPDGDPLDHVTIHAAPSGAELVGRDGNSLAVPLQINAQMLVDGEIGLYSSASQGTEFSLVFTVSDGSLDSAHSVLTVTLSDQESAPPEQDPPRIDLSDWTGPVVTLADGFIPGPASIPSADVVAFWLSGDSEAGVLEAGDNDQ